MRKYIKLFIPMVIIIIVVFSIKMIMDNPPSSGKKYSKSASKIPVEVMQIIPKDFDPVIQSYGLVDATIKTDLSSQISGKVIFVSENLKDGAFFKKGEILAKIEDIDYKADVQIANSNLTLAKQNLLEEEAKAKQAKEEWERLNSSVSPSALVLRTPQLESAKANVKAAMAQLEKAKLALNRTKIIAPYDGRVIKKNIAISQVVSNTTSIANIYALDNLEIRLAVKSKDISFFDLNKQSEVKLISSISQKEYKGKIIRSESTIDTNSAQLYLIAQIKANKELYIGEYTKAYIKATTLKNSILIPNNTIYQGSFVYVEKDGIITQRDIKVLLQGDKNSIIKEGLKADENIVLTSLGVVSSGTAVNVIKGDKR